MTAALRSLLAGLALVTGIVAAVPTASTLSAEGTALTQASADAAASLDPDVSPSPFPTDAARAGPVVRGVFFFSPTCPHCEIVIRDHLPGVFERFGGAPDTAIDESIAREDVAFYLMSNGILQLLLVDVSIDTGARMFVADSERLGVAQAVPRLDIADQALMGSRDIPAELPAITEAALADEGLDWPAVPDLARALAPFPQAGGEDVAGSPSAPSTVQLPAASLSVWDRVSRDLPANLVAIGVLILLLVSLVAVPILALHGRLAGLRPRWAWLVPTLASAGIAISAYLGYVDENGLAAVCGPLGDCDAVAASEFARLFGSLPTWVLGIVGYSLVLAGWIVARLLQARTAAAIGVGVVAVVYAGTLFSAWLTFLEPFVIGATCLWCILSALTMASLLWLTAGDGAAALRRLLRVT